MSTNYVPKVREFPGMNRKTKLWSVFFVLILRSASTWTCPVKEGCEYDPITKTVRCRGELTNTGSSNTNVTFLEVCDVNVDVLNLGELAEEFPQLQNVSVYYGNITNVTVDVGADNNIKVLKLKHLHLRSFDLDGLLGTLKNLQILDLSENLLQTLSVDAALLSGTKLQKLYISGNPWNCSLSTQWILDLAQKDLIDGVNNLSCHGQPYPGKPLLPIARFLSDVKTMCPRSCVCSMPNVVRDLESKHLEPIIQVNCSDRSLEAFPGVLPSHTKIVHLENNDIDNLGALTTNPYYRGVTDLYLDNNRIASIEDLEGSHWLSHFRVLSLSGNKITQIPTYALDNALQRNPNMPNAVLIYFADNPWRCDCVFTPRFQEMLQKYQPQIQDVDDVKCSYVEGDDNSLLPILELTRSSVCHLPSEYSVRALDLLNGILATLIILVLGKLIYDYYYFKRTGRLPWIVTKMP